MEKLRSHLDIINSKIDEYIIAHYTGEALSEKFELCCEMPDNFGDRQERSMRAIEPKGARCEKRNTPKVARGIASLDDYIKKTETFQQMLFRIIEEKDLKAADVYKKANMTKQTFSKIRWDENYHPSKRTAIALAISLELNKKQTNTLLSKAGYTLDSALMEDMVVQFFIENKIYNLMEIDMALYDRDLPTISNYL